MDLLLTKFLSMLILGASTFLVGLSTIQLRKVLGIHTSEVRRSQTVVTSILLCFGAGVLLATAMLHILPEVREGMVETQESMGIEYLAELVFCVGFFLVYIIEELVHFILHSTQHREQFHKTLALRQSREHVDSTCNTVPECCEKDGDCHNDMEVGLSVPNSDLYPISITVPKKELKPQDNTQSAGHSHLPVCKGSQSSLMRDLITVLALSFHAIFEGMAVGLEGNSKDVWALFTAIAVHKLVITFCLSLEMLQSGPTMLVFFSYLVTFSLVNPFGIGMGMVISEIGTTSEVTVCVLQGIAAGTILYVIMFEILQREKEKDVSGALQLIGILVGFGAMILLQSIAHEPHEDEEEDDVAQNATLRGILNLGLGQRDVENDFGSGSEIGNTNPFSIL